MSEPAKARRQRQKKIFGRLLSDLDAARAKIEQLMIGTSDLARQLGEAKGKLEACQTVGVVEGWKARAEAAEARLVELERERDGLRHDYDSLRRMVHAWMGDHPCCDSHVDDFSNYVGSPGDDYKPLAAHPAPEDK